MESEEKRTSLFPAVRRVFKDPIVKWLVGSLAALLTATVTTGVWPFFKGWVITRADVDTVVKIDGRVVKLEEARKVDYKRLASAKKDDTGALTEGEQVQWSLIRIKRLEMMLVAETRARIGLEARLRMPDPNSPAAKRVEVQIKAKFDDLMFKGEELEEAVKKAQEFVYGSSD